MGPFPGGNFVIGTGNDPFFIDKGLSSENTVNAFPEILTGLILVAEFRNGTVEHQGIFHGKGMKSLEKDNVVFFSAGQYPGTETHGFTVGFFLHGNGNFCIRSNPQRTVLDVEIISL